MSRGSAVEARRVCEKAERSENWRAVVSAIECEGQTHLCHMLAGHRRKMLVGVRGRNFQ